MESTVDDLDTSPIIVKMTESGLSFLFHFFIFIFLLIYFPSFLFFRTLGLGLEVIDHISHI